MPDALWARAVAEAAEDPPAGLIAAAKAELAELWNDLDRSIHAALRGGWSMGCDNATIRIIHLSRIVGATWWAQVPIPLVLDGVYQGIYTAAGITFDAPSPEDMQQMREWGARDSIPRVVPAGS